MLAMKRGQAAIVFKYRNPEDRQKCARYARQWSQRPGQGFYVIVFSGIKESIKESHFSVSIQILMRVFRAWRLRVRTYGF